MNSLKSSTSACRHCRFYTPEGRRGGNCQQLGVRVGGNWTSCSLALPAFAPSWESIDDGWRLVSQVGSHKAFWQVRAEETDSHIGNSDRSNKPTNAKSTGTKENKTATSITV